MKLLRLIVGFALGIALVVSVHTWVSPKVLDGTARWLRKTTGTERSVGEKIINRLDEAGDTLKGDESLSRKIRETGGEIADAAKDAAKEAGDKLEEVAEDVKKQ